MTEDKKERKGAKGNAKAQRKTREDKKQVRAFLSVLPFFLCVLAASSGVLLP
jgi:hypothetical protein